MDITNSIYNLAPQSRFWPKVSINISGSKQNSFFNLKPLKMKKHLTTLMLLTTVLVLASCTKAKDDKLPDNPTLAVSKSELYFNTPYDSTIVISVESNVDWVSIKEGDEGAQWVTVSPEKGSASITASEVNISVTKNETGEKRIAVITFSHNKGSKSEQVTITQSPQLSPLGMDSVILVELYESTSGWSWKKPWDIETPVSTWGGIKVSPRNGELRVVELDLQDQLIKGALPESIKNLTELTLFQSYTNFFNTPLPLFFTEMPKLRKLVLGKSGFTGEIPEKYYDMTQLEVLQLEANHLSGGLSEKISQLSKLDNLSFGNCGLSGPIPASIGTMPVLRDINLFGNNFSGDIPSEIGNAPKLELLRFDECPKLTGGIPESFGNIENLTILHITGNSQMKGTLPASLGNCKKLWELLVSFSGTTGSIPSEWINATALTTIQAYNTQLGGDLPNWDKHPALEDLVITNLIARPDTVPFEYNNHFTGPLPKFVGHLKLFNASNNDFSGGLNDAIINSTTLQQFEVVGSKQMTGDVDSKFWFSTNLTHVNLSNTGLGGLLPTDAEFEAAQKSLVIQELSIQNCKFEGPIPSNLFLPEYTSKLSTARLGGNNFTGNVPASIRSCEGLNNLTLAGNRLSGEFPEIVKTHPSWLSVNLWNPLVNICPQQEGPGWGFTGTSCEAEAPTK